MKGIILAGGLGTRLAPFTSYANKHVLPVYDRPMIEYPIRSLVSWGITEVAIVVSGPFTGQVINLVRDGADLGLKSVTYLFQERPDGGIADALRLARPFAAEEPIVVMLGDNTMDCPEVSLEGFTEGARVFLKEVPNPKDFGVAEVNESGRVVSLEEKPVEPKSNLAVIGLYLYDSSVFEKIERCSVSGRGQLEITDVNRFYLEEGKLESQQISGFWSDAGTPESLQKASEYWARKC